MSAEFLELGFEKNLYAVNRPSLADSFTEKNRCGIYILHFQNGEYYVGQAIDVVKRHAQHRKTHSDIEELSFLEVAKSKLAQVEKQTVSALESRKKPLRNINLVSILSGGNDLSLVVSTREQERWLNRESDTDKEKANRFDYPELRKKYRGKFEKLKKSDKYTQTVRILRKYVKNAIPFPCRTEYSFWSCTCLPGGRVLARININWQEVFAIYGRGPFTKIFLSESKLFKKYSDAELDKKYPSMALTDLTYVPGGADQQCIVVGESDIMELLDDTLVLDAMRDFNLRLMQKGGCIYNRYHCFDLADKALRT